MRKYYKHNTILKLLQFNPKKNNILSYFTKDITQRIELKQYKQIKSIDKQILIMYGNNILFILRKGYSMNCINGIFKYSNKYSYNYGKKNIQFKLNTKLEITEVSFYKTMNNGSICINYTSNCRTIYFNKWNIFYNCLYKTNIHYQIINATYIRNSIINTVYYYYINNKIYYFNYRLNDLKMLYVKPIIIIPNKYELDFNSNFIRFYIYWPNLN